jgi:hypothetical protein
MRYAQARTVGIFLAREFCIRPALTMACLRSPEWAAGSVRAQCSLRNPLHNF